MSLFSVDKNGIITVDTSNIRESVEEAYKQALGSDLNLETGTPQGQLVANDTQFLSYAQEQAVQLANSFSVLTAQGAALDTAGGFWGYYRKQNISTVVNASCNGVAGTLIPAGSKASSGNYTYTLLNDVTILPSGSVIGSFQCDTSGAISCLPNTLNTIVNPVSGWDSVNNDVAGIMGYDTESDSLFRDRITANWLNIRAKSILGAIIDNVAQIPDVISVVGRENMSTTTRIIDGVTMVPNSIYLCVLGGKGSAIAKVLTEQKTLGAATNGNRTVSYSDPIVQYNYDYTIRRPDMVNLEVQVQYRKNYYTPADVEQQIINNIQTYINNNPFMIGSVISGSDLMMGLVDFQYADILAIKVGLSGETLTDYVETSLEQVGVVSTITAEEVTNG